MLPMPLLAPVTTAMRMYDMKAFAATCGGGWKEGLIHLENRFQTLDNRESSIR